LEWRAGPAAYHDGVLDGVAERADAWAKLNGYSKAEIDAAKRCLK
jgi:hypothetical protein